MNVLRDYATVLLAVVSVAVCATCPTASAATETMRRFDASITVRADGSLLVVEAIDYNFSTNEKRGIFRTIPLRSKNGPRVQISVKSVKDLEGRNYESNTTIEDNTLRVRIGSPNVFVTGMKSYVLTYEVRNVIRSFEDHGELYWNVTGNDWPVAIESARAVVTLPPAAVSGAKAECYTGRLGSTAGECTASVDATGATYTTAGPLEAGEGLTIVLGFPDGHVTGLAVAESAPTPRRRRASPEVSIVQSPVYRDPDRENLVFAGIGVVVLGVATTFFLFVFGSVTSSRSLRRKPKPVIPYDLRSRPIVVEYRPPDDLTPIEVGTIADRRMDITDVSSVIVDLAVRGYLKIRHTVTPRLLLPDPKDYEIERLKSESDLDHPADEIVFDMLFKRRDVLTLSDLKARGGSTLTKLKFLKATVEKRLYDKGYFDQRAEKRYRLLLAFAPVALFAGLVLALWGVSEASLPPQAYAVVVGLFFLLALVLVVARARHSLVLSDKGKTTLSKILGFREFLRLTEKGKLGPDVPELRPEMFEAFLPYAMVLGIEEQWTEKFEGIYETQPEWYVDPTMSTFSSAMLTHQVMTFGRSFHDTMRVIRPPAPPASTGAFSSGFRGGGFGGGGRSGGGGGGFSGGGSGGGGGGSW